MTGEDDIEGARAVAHGLNLFPGAAARELSIGRLGGLTNRVYRIAHEARAVCLRIPGKGTEEYINRQAEAVAARGAAAAGVSPRVILANAEAGVMVTEFIAGTVTMTPALFASRAGAPGRAGRAFRQLHDSGARFDFRFELFAMIDRYMTLLETKPITFPEGYRAALADAARIRAALAAHPASLAPCHCDPLSENFLDTGERMWIVDWEYSGMNDPMWDLGDLAVEAEFDSAAEEEMLRAYFAGSAGAFDRGRMVIYKAMCDLLWTLWGLIQVANANPADDFQAYAENRFRRCRTLMATDAFGASLRAVERGPIS
jgi:thiamine kinase-like enzyme